MVRGVNVAGTPKVSAELLGRDREVASLTAALDDAALGQGRMCLLAGEPGIGKTRLADEVSSIAREHGALVVWGRSWEGGGAPAYWPWIQVLRWLLSELGPDVLLTTMGDGAPSVARIIPELGKVTDETAPIHGTHEQDRFAMFDAMARLVRNLSKDRFLVLVLDDLHAADEASLRLLHFIARGLRDSRTLVVGTFVENAPGVPPESRDLMSAISREGAVIRLAGLATESVAHLYEKLAGTPPSEPALAAINEATAGNPYFVAEAIRLESSEGDLRRPDLSLGFKVPKGAKEVMHRLLAPLSDGALAVVSTAAVIGQAFDFPIVKDVVAIDEKSLMALLDEATHAGVLRERGFGRYEFTHVLLRETVYEDLGAADRMRLHSLVADALEERYRDDSDAHIDELAHHCFKAGQAADNDKALTYLMRAGDKASVAMAHEEAARLYHRALKVAEWAGVPTERRRRIASLISTAEAQAKVATRAEAGRMAEENSFLSEGQYWSITFDGRVCRVKDSKGIRYLHQLVKNPNVEIHVLDLFGVTDGAARSSSPSRDDALAMDGGDAGAVLDAEAKAQYRRRLEELAEEIEEAHSYNDPERAAKAEAEQDALVDQLATGVGLGGRDRRAASQSERARVNVTKALRSAIAIIGETRRSLGHHFQTTVRTGSFCSYNPDPSRPNPWRV